VKGSYNFLFALKLRLLRTILLQNEGFFSLNPEGFVPIILITRPLVTYGKYYLFNEGLLIGGLKECTAGTSG
jgi:hypothetical protein